QSAPSFLVLSNNKANYVNFLELVNFRPQVFHFAGYIFFSNSSPFKMFLNLNDRVIFSENVLEMDFKGQIQLFSCSISNSVKPDLSEIFALWRTLSLVHVPNLIISHSNSGQSGLFFSTFYDKLVEGKTFGEAFIETTNKLIDVQEASPISRTGYILIGNPKWRMKK
ncbi:MAG: hypothetical protein ACTSYS_04135, partial [Promethearchaeota archaeon]